MDPLDESNCGGHHRAIAHQIMDSPLRALIIGKTEEEYLEDCQPIKDLTVVSDPEAI